MAAAIEHNTQASGRTHLAGEREQDTALDENLLNQRLIGFVSRTCDYFESVTIIALPCSENMHSGS